jgi:hypothetical protein
VGAPDGTAAAFSGAALRVVFPRIDITPFIISSPLRNVRIPLIAKHASCLPAIAVHGADDPYDIVSSAAKFSGNAMPPA